MNIDTFLNLDLLTVGITIAANILIGFAAFISNKSSATNKLFFLQTIILSLWSLTNYISYQQNFSPATSLLLVRLVLCLAVPNSVVFLLLMNTFPSEKIKIAKSTFISLCLITLVVMIITLTPLLFKGIIINENQAPTPIPNVGLIPFIILAVISLPIGIFYLIKNFINSHGIERKQLMFLLIGVTSMFLLIIPLNFIFPAIFQNTKFIPYSAFFTFPFVAFTAYSIYKHRLFNIKVVGTAILTFLLAVITFAEIIFADTLSLIIFRSSIFLLVIIVGINLLRGVLKEVNQREKIEKLAGELKVANEGQANLMHIMNHQIKGRLGNAKNIFAELLTDDYGKVTDEAKFIIQKGLEETNEGVNYVQNILKGISAETGNLPYEMTRIDVRDVITKVVEKQKQFAEKKGLDFAFTAAEGDYAMTGDSLQLGEAIKNIIDNSINYTPSGKISVDLKQKGKTILFTIKDTGVGLSNDDKASLFKAGGRGKESIKINVNSTGYGLSFVKGVVEAHKGKVWAESEGKGKGSEFYVELPRI